MNRIVNPPNSYQVSNHMWNYGQKLISNRLDISVSEGIMDEIMDSNIHIIEYHIVNAKENK